MVFDKLENCKLYYGMNEKFEKAFDFIKKAVDENLPVGKYEIDGTELYASVAEYTSKLESEGKFEGHQKYIDIQYIVSGIETMEVMDISKATSNTEYNEVKDIEFYANTDKAGCVVVESGEYGIFLPHDIHKPGMAFENKQTAVKKIIVKVRI